MAGPLTPKCQYDHVSETVIAFSTCSTLSLCRIYTLEQLTGLRHSYGSLVPRLKDEDEIRFDCIPITFFAGQNATGKPWSEARNDTPPLELTRGITHVLINGEHSKQFWASSSEVLCTV